MLRTVAIRNEPVLRGLLSKAPRARVSLRLLSTQTLRKLQLRHSNNEIRKLKPTSSWSTNFARAYSDLPKHFKVALPALSPTMEKGTIISWEKKEGDKLNEGDLLAEIETDKATMGFETPEEGYLAKILVQAGTKDVPIGKIVCIIVQKQEDIAAFKDFKDDGAVAAKPPPAPAAPSPSAAATPTPAAPTPASAPAPQTAASSGTRVYASPMAKRLAEVQKLRVEGQGSGVFGSIKSGDLAGLKPAGAAKGKAVAAGAPGPYADIPVTNMRAVIAKRLLESKQQIPHYYVTMECHVDELLKMRENVNKLHEKDKIRVTVNDFIVKAMATACRKVPETNSSWRGDVIRQFKNVDVSVAVSTNAGLITPIIFGADQKGIVEISNITKELAAKARANKLKPNEFQGGTVCISNMGMFGVHHFEAVINPPQSLILAVGGTQKKLVVDKNDSRGFKEISTMYVTISADHRVVDGAVAAKWLQHFTSFMEKPALMLL